MKIIIDTKENISHSVSEEMIELINNNPEIVLGLATGSTPLDIYKELIQAYNEKRVSFKNVRSFNLDEYVGLKETDPQSYHYFMKENFFSKTDIDINNTKVPTMETYLNYDKMIENAGGIDFQILGIGSDGHIAFNEPGSALDSTTHMVKLKESTIKDNSRFFNDIKDVPTKSITMGLKSIMNAKKIVLIAFGANKAKAVKEMIEGKVSTSCPASILQLHPDVTVYLDKDAASLLTK